MAKKKMILDLDTGVDDALAIAYATASPEVDLIGIVASYGNNLRDVCAANSLKLLHLLGQDSVPVYPGPNHSLTTASFSVMKVSKQIHGQNGIGEVELPEPSHPLESETGANFIIQAAHKYRKDLVIVPTGPMTNLAVAIKKDPTIISEIGNVTFMGGALTVPGNVSATAEANIHQDPVAANTVLRSGLPLTMVGLDVTMQTLLTKDDTAKWRSLATQAGQKYADITDFYIDAYDQLDIDHRGCALHDPLAVGVAIDPTLVQTISLPLIVTTNGADVGRTVGDPALSADPDAPRVTVAYDLNPQTYLARFMKRLTALFTHH